MDQSVRDFLEELCEMLKRLDEATQSLCDDPDGLEYCCPNEEDRRQLLALLRDVDARKVLIRLTRQAATAAVFHVLVLLDERKELGQTKVRPSLKLYVNDSEVPCPNYLHELLGDAMLGLGMDTYDWW
jgi:hypothetical protein